MGQGTHCSACVFTSFLSFIDLPTISRGKIQTRNKLFQQLFIVLSQLISSGRYTLRKSFFAITSVLNFKSLYFQGHTRLVNFFNINSKMYLVDLPGYGYVEGLGSKRGTEHFVKVAETYLRERAGKE